MATNRQNTVQRETSARAIGSEQFRLEARGNVRPRSRYGLVCFGLLTVSLFAGCVHRRMTVNSDPPGARVLLDGDEIGETPTSVDFTHYGTREVVLQKDGYDTLKTMQTVRPPWYQVFPLEFFSDNLSPIQLTNRHEFKYQLQANPTVTSTQGLRDRANNLRSDAHSGQ